VCVCVCVCVCAHARACAVCVCASLGRGIRDIKFYLALSPSSIELLGSWVSQKLMK